MSKRRATGPTFASALVAIAMSLALPITAAAFTTGVDTNIWSSFGSWSSADKAGALSLISQTAARTSRINVTWRDVARTQPSNAADPADPAYRWAYVDSAVRSADALGVETEITQNYAPTWAEGSDRPSTGYGPCFTAALIYTTPPCAGSWLPNPVAFGEFAKALATRYSGNWPDPLNSGSNLPRVKLFEAWNEPNYKYFLSPQCPSGIVSSSTGKCPNGSPLIAVSHYRKMLNAFYDGVKSIQPDATVSIGGVGPAAGSSQGPEIDPQVFLQVLMCLGGTTTSPVALASSRCPTKAKFDAVSFHPYSMVGTPTYRSKGGRGLFLGNVPDLRRLLVVALSNKTVQPASAKLIWATEMGWLTCPPCRPGRADVTPAKAGAYTAESLYRLWAAKVDRVFWFGLIDEPPREPNNPNSYQWPGGLFYSGETIALSQPKPSLTGFRFPAFAVRAGKGVSLWALTPCRAPDSLVRFEGLYKGSWQLIRSAVPNADSVVSLVGIRLARSFSQIRATSAGSSCPSESSLPTGIAAS